MCQVGVHVASTAVRTCTLDAKLESMEMSSCTASNSDQNDISKILGISSEDRLLLKTWRNVELTDIISMGIELLLSPYACDWSGNM